MGDEIEFTDSAEIKFAVEARDSIKLIKIYKNSRLYKVYTRLDFTKDHNRGADLNRHLARIEWGWDMLSSDKITQWDITLHCLKGKIFEIEPCFCGGAGSVTEVNRLLEKRDNLCRIHSFTSRKNALPVSSVSFLWEGDGDSRIELAVSGNQDRTAFQRSIAVTKKELLENDFYESVLGRFSGPKIKIHSLVMPQGYQFGHSFTDNEVRPGDFYFLKTTQENGQMAWSSPVWIGGGK
jgi:hypothetical protein